MKRNNHKKIVSLFLIFILMFSLLFLSINASSVKEDVTLDDINRTWVGYVRTETQAHPSIADIGGGSYLLVWEDVHVGDEIYGVTSTDKTSFNNAKSSIIISSDYSGINTVEQPALSVCGDYVYCAAKTTGTGYKCHLFRCNLSKDVTNHNNWEKVCIIGDGSQMSGHPIDPCLMMFETPVNGHKYWCQCLNKTGVESQDRYRCVYYSDDLNDIWTLNTNPVLTSPYSNFPAFSYYYEPADGWIIFNSQGDENGEYSNIVYGYTNDINTTWTMTETILVPYNIDTENNDDDMRCIEPTLYVDTTNDTIYCYYACYQTESSYKRMALCTFSLSGFITENESIELLSINGGLNESIIYTSSLTINWTVVTNASQYHLEIDNNIDFSSPEINYTNINQWNYPSNCEINTTRVSFTLPSGLTSYDKYYMRVRAYTKS